MADDKIVLEIELDDGTIKKTFARIRSDGESAAKNLETSFGSKLANSFFSLRTALVGAFAAIGGGVALKNIVQAGIESDKAWRSFNVALASTGQLSTDTVASFEAYANSLQRITGVQDEVIASGASLLLNVGRISKDALQPATQAALDLSAALQISADTAFTLLSKAANGSTEALGRYGIKIDESIPKSERFAAVLQLIQTRFGGQAAAAAQTFEGGLLRLSNGFSDITENIGRLVTKSPAAVAVINKLADIVGTVSEKITNLGKDSDPIKPIIQSILQFNNAFIEFFIKPLELGFNIGKVFVNAFLTGIQTIIAGVGQLGLGIVNLLDAVGISINGSLAQSIRDFASSSSTVLQEFAINTQTAFSGLTNANISQPIQDFNNELLLASTQTPVTTAAISNNIATMSNKVDENLKKMEDRAKQVNQAFNGILAGGISQGVQRITQSILAGQASFQNFSKVILGIIGDMAIQLGGVLIGTGLGIEALKALGGSAAIAAGIGLVALGTILKSFSGGAEGAGASGGSFSGGGFSGGTSSVTEDNTSDLERQAPSTAVTVNINGNVLDRRSTGLEIADIIAESFDANGTRVIGATA